MIKRFLSAVLLLTIVVSCTEDNSAQETASNNSVKKNYLSCSINGIELYSSQISFWYGPDISMPDVVFLIDWKSNFTSYEDIKRFRLRSVMEGIVEKEEKLVANLPKSGFNFYLPNNVSISCCYGYISGPARVYSDSNVAGVPSGENLSAIFLAAGTENPLALISYPDMDIIKVLGKEMEGVPFDDYFVEGTVPLLDASSKVELRIKEEYQDQIDKSMVFHFELPITAVTMDGEEKSMVLKGDFHTQ